VPNVAPVTKKQAPTASRWRRAVGGPMPNIPPRLGPPMHNRKYDFLDLI